MKNKLFTIIISSVLLAACGKNDKAADPLADTGRTQRTENLLANMKMLAEKGFMFGHHDDPVYGIGWVGDSARSDVKSVCGDAPAVVSFDLGHIELGDSLNLDGVPFDRIRQEIFRHFSRGGVVALSWHLDNPLTGGNSWVNDSVDKGMQGKTVAAILEGGAQHEKFMGWLDRVADYLNSLETPYGVKVPVIFRPWHEHTGDWFWWGQKWCTTDQYKALWRMTQERMKEKGVTNLLWAYSPGTECGGDSTKYLERYPGDEDIDVLGLDTYCFAEEGDSAAFKSFAENLDRHLDMLCKIGKGHGKAVALTETGYEGIKRKDWWTAVLLPTMRKYPICYALVWRNAHDKPGHFYAPYPGQKSSADFVKFYNDKKTLFLRDVNALYLKKEVRSEERGVRKEE